MEQIKVDLIETMGSDLTTVNAARVSFNKESNWAVNYMDNSIDLAPRDKKLIGYLAEHEHMSPFGHSFASFRVKAPVFVARQLVKHEYLRMNEVSRRYVTDEPELYYPKEWRGVADNVKQGSSDSVIDVGDINLDHILDLYDDLLYKGVCPEQARMVLPQAMLTEWYWSGSLDAFAKMCNLRRAKDTQQETRVVADKVSNLLQYNFPDSWKALTNDKP